MFNFTITVLMLILQMITGIFDAIAAAVERNRSGDMPISR